MRLFVCRVLQSVCGGSRVVVSGEGQLPLIPLQLLQALEGDWRGTDVQGKDRKRSEQHEKNELLLFQVCVWGASQNP